MLTYFLGVTYAEIEFYNYAYAYYQQRENALYVDEEISKQAFIDTMQQKLHPLYTYAKSIETDNYEDSTLTDGERDMIKQLAITSGISYQDAQRATYSLLQEYAHTSSHYGIDRFGEVHTVPQSTLDSVEDTSYLKTDVTEMQHRQQQALYEFKDRAHKTLADVKINLSVDTQALTDALAAVNHIIDGVTDGYVDVYEGGLRIQEIQNKIQRQK